MRFKVTFKDPEGPYDCIRDAAKASAAEVEGIDEEERDALEEHRADQMRKFSGKWLAYGEYVTIEFDTDAGTAVVVKEK